VESSISIIIPSYNVEAYLEKCVKLLIPQLGKEDEILIVNDGTAAIADAFSIMDKRIIALHKENGGLSSVRNFGLEHAKGEYVSFVDSDDYVSKDYLEVLHNSIATNIDVLGFGLCRVVEGKEIAYVLPLLEGYFDESQVRLQVLPEIICRKSIFERSMILGSACTYLYSRRFLMNHDIRFKSERVYLNEDLLFNIEVFANAKNVEFVPRILYYYILRDGSLTQQFHPKIYETKKNIGLSCEKILEENGLENILQDRMNGFWIKGIYECIVHEVWKYSPYNKVQQNNHVKCYLNNERLTLALKQYPRNQLNSKGKIICFLMRCKMYKCIIYGYSLFEKRKVKRDIIN